MSTDALSRQTSFLILRALQSFGLILLFGILIRTFLVSSYVMSGTAMLPSILPGDFLVGLRLPLGEVRRGSIVALRCPHGREQICLKRVIGVEGDRIDFNKDRLHVNGQPVMSRRVGGEFAMETVVGESWLIWPGAGGGPSQVVPPGHIYVLNDKRSDTEDSRNWGAVPVDMIEAKATGIWLSLDWYEGSTVRAWPRVRWERVFRSIR